MHFYKTICCSLSLLFNFSLSYLIIFQSPTKLGVYKYLMLYTSVFEGVYSILDTVVEPVFHSQVGGFIVFRHSENSLFNRERSLIILCLYCGCFGFSLALFGVQFIYRYGAVESLFHKKYLSGNKILVLFILPFIYHAWWAGIAYVFLPYESESDKIMESSVIGTYGYSMKDISYVSLIYHLPSTNINEDRGKSHVNWRVFNVSYCFFFMVISSMFCVLYFGIKCYCDIRKTLEITTFTSNYTKSLQQQLFQALVVQTLIPIVLMYFPSGLLFTFAILKLNLGFNDIVGMTISTYPAIDPLPNMLIIRSYRVAIKNFLGFMITRPFRKVTISTQNNYSNGLGSTALPVM